MKQTATLLVEVAGRTSGSTAVVASQGERTVLLEDGNGQFTASRESVEITYASTDVPAPAAVEEKPKPEKDGLGKANELLKLQGVDGTWNYDRYMHGMFNGMEVVIATIEDRKPEFREAPEKWLADKREPAPLVERLTVDEPTEKAARLMYDNYNEHVGGVAWNGDKLPTADEFFEDPTKQKQANAWRVVAGNTIGHLYAAGVLVDGPLEDDQPTAAYKQRTVIDEIGKGETKIRVGDMVLYGEIAEPFEVAKIEEFPHGLMVGIYDEPPGKHVDFVKPDSVKLHTRGPDRPDDEFHVSDLKAASEPQPGSAGETIPDGNEDGPPNNGVDSDKEEE